MSLLNKMRLKNKSLFKVFITIVSGSLIKNDIKKRHLFAPSCNDYSAKASMTVEASVVLPVLVFAMMFVMIYFRVITIEWGISAGATDLVRTVALSGEKASSESLGDFGLSGAARALLEKNEVFVNDVSGGSLGVSFFGSGITEKDVDIKVNYSINLPVSLFGRKVLFITQRAKARRWIGYDPKENMENGEYVYITKNGVAYHRNVKCPYLNPSVSAVSSSMVGEKRNSSGGKYYPCEQCAKGGMADICYITDYGDVYHVSVTCKSLMRYIDRVLLENVGGRHACPKCG